MRFCLVVALIESFQKDYKSSFANDNFPLTVNFREFEGETQNILDQAKFCQTKV